MVPRARWAAGRKFTLIVMAGLAVFPGILWGMDKLEFKPGFNLFSISQDVQMGKEASVEIDKQVPLVSDAETLQYISGLERKLAGLAPGNHAEYIWQVKVVNRAEINSFALPGGYI